LQVAILGHTETLFHSSFLQSREAVGRLQATSPSRRDLLVAFRENGIGYGLHPLKLTNTDASIWASKFH
jgi:hypothetical protein